MPAELRPGFSSRNQKLPRTNAAADVPSTEKGAVKKKAPKKTETSMCCCIFSLCTRLLSHHTVSPLSAPGKLPPVTAKKKQTGEKVKASRSGTLRVKTRDVQEDEEESQEGQSAAPKRSIKLSLPGANRCPSCEKSVYAAEEIIADERHFHKS